jgi:ATP-dependent Lon protease
MATDPGNRTPELTTFPLLPLRDVVVFPHMVIPLFVGRPKSIKALDVAMEAGKHILLVAQRSAAKDEPGAEDLYAIASVATVLQMLKLPDGTVKVLVEGTQRAQILRVDESGDYLSAEATLLLGGDDATHEIEAMRRALLGQFDQYVKLNKKIPPEILTSMSGIDDGGRLADAIAAHLPLKLEQKQEILEMQDVGKRLEHLLGLLEGEVDILQVEKRIRGRVKRQMEKSQREYYLNEQVKAIQKELGEGDDNADLDETEKKLKAAKMSKEAESKAIGELKKLRMMSPMSAEATVVRNYIDTLLGLPWKKKSKINKDLGNAVKVLDADHYGLEKVKERIVEYLAVQQRVDRLKAPILCLVGAPGVGKTSLGQSIARATNRKFVRMSLGGDPRSPAYVHRVDARQDSAEHDQDRRAEPAVPARRGRQDGDGFSRRPVIGAARSARSGAEQYVRRPLCRSRVRPVGRDVRRDGKHAEHPAGAARPDGGDPLVRLHRG